MSFQTSIPMSAFHLQRPSRAGTKRQILTTSSRYPCSGKAFLLALSKELAGRAQEDPSSFVEVVYLRQLQSKLPQHGLVGSHLQSEIAAL
jgi:hypothetical protein